MVLRVAFSLGILAVLEAEIVSERANVVGKKGDGGRNCDKPRKFIVTRKVNKQWAYLGRGKLVNVVVEEGEVSTVAMSAHGFLEWVN